MCTVLLPPGINLQLNIYIFLYIIIILLRMRNFQAKFVEKIKLVDPHEGGNRFIGNFGHSLQAGIAQDTRRLESSSIPL
jgi:hypothetical protein